MPRTLSSASVRHLVVVLGDQLDRCSAAFDDFDSRRDAVLMMEVEDEASWVPQHKARLVLFFSVMRHFREELEEHGVTVHYGSLDDEANRGALPPRSRVSLPGWLPSVWSSSSQATTGSSNRSEPV